MIFGNDDDFRYHGSKGALPSMVRIERQVSYFGDKGGLDQLKRYVGEEKGIERQILDIMWDAREEEEISYTPFSTWPQVKDLENEFKDLVQCMMQLDPKKRITARDALDHPWFARIAKIGDLSSRDRHSTAFCSGNSPVVFDSLEGARLLEWIIAGR